jgi:hypothetical protein
MRAHPTARSDVNREAPHKLIIVEGLTGSGKSIMAHFIARQLRYNGVDADWVHEGALPHPLAIDVESTIEAFMADAQDRWQGFANRVTRSDTVLVVEACLFNLLIESLFTHNVAQPDILSYADTLQEIIRPLHPALVYLTQRDVPAALERNFRDRGAGFQEFVVGYATGTPYARARGLQGYDGMVVFWRDFVALTDELFDRYAIDKLKIENSAGEWERYNRQVMDFLSLPTLDEPAVSEEQARRLVGTYRDEVQGRAFPVVYEEGRLLINFFQTVWTHLIPDGEGAFSTAGWYFEIRFEHDSTREVRRLVFGGRDVDYLALVGTMAEKVDR